LALLSKHEHSETKNLFLLSKSKLCCASGGMLSNKQMLNNNPSADATKPQFANILQIFFANILQISSAMT